MILFKVLLVFLVSVRKRSGLSSYEAAQLFSLKLAALLMIFLSNEPPNRVSLLHKREETLKSISVAFAAWLIILLILFVLNFVNLDIFDV